MALTADIKRLLQDAVAKLKSAYHWRSETLQFERLDERKLIQEAWRQGDVSVLGLLCDAAQERYPHPKFERLMLACKPAEQVEPFFRRVARSRLALKLAQEGALDVFRRWGYLGSELQYR